MKKFLQEYFHPTKKEYDSTEIDSFVNTLYRSADISIITYTVLGVFLGGTIGYSAFRLTSMALGSSALGGVIGYQFGQSAAYKQKAEAQLALCQVEIEKNLRNNSQT